MSSVDVNELDGIPVVQFSGDCDEYDAHLLSEQIDALLESGQNTMIIDLTGTDYISSKGLGVLTTRHKKCLADKGNMAVVCSDQRILKVFEITCLDKLFAVRASPEDARKALA